MTNKYSKHLQATQREPIFGLEDKMVKNDAGGYVFEASNIEKLRRFLILGTEGGTYYCGERVLTVSAARFIKNMVKDCDTATGRQIVNEIVSVSKEGQAPKNDNAIFALALVMAHARIETRQYASKMVNSVCRTGTHIMQFAEYSNMMRGKGRLWRKAIENWFTSKDAKSLTYQAIKYRQRNGWTLKDLLRLSHPRPQEVGHDEIYQWICGKGVRKTSTNKQLYCADKLINSVVENEDDKKLGPVLAAQYIREGSLPFEAVPTEYLKDYAVWDELLPYMPLHARIRNLGRLTANGFLSHNSQMNVDNIVKSLGDKEYIKKSRVHPFNIFVAKSTYDNGSGLRGKLSWTPIPQISAALENAFYDSFSGFEPSGKRILVALDCSGSMKANVGLTHTSAFYTSGILALVLAKMENALVFAFDECASDVMALNINSASNLTSARIELSKANTRLHRGTNLSAPITYFTNNKIHSDAIVILTDNQTWYGDSHPVQAIKKYRSEISKDAKLIIVAMCENDYSIVPSNSELDMNVIGLDLHVPKLIVDFTGGRF